MRAPIALIALLCASPALAGTCMLSAPPPTPSAAASRPALPVIRVNIVGSRPDGTPDDRRATLARGAPALGLSPDEAQRIRASTGLVLCNEDSDGMRPLASGVLVGSGDRIVTAAHVMRDPRRNWAALPAGTACLFRTQTEPPETVPLRIDGTEILGSGGRDDLWDPNDYAVIRLAHPLASPDARPFPLADPPESEGDPVILISAFQADLRDRLGIREPIAQKAQVELPGKQEGRAPRALYLAGAMDAGGSGGAMLVRSDGNLALAGIVSSTGAINRNGFPFSLQMMSFIRVIAVDGSFRAAIENRAVAGVAQGPSGACGPRMC